MLQLHQIRVPLDDTHTMYWWYHIYPKQPGEPDQRPEDIPLYQVPLPGVDANGLPIWELADNNSGQDNYAWVSQGPITPRWTEHLGESDKGIILYRRLLRENMKIVEDGGDPMNTFRDPATNVSVHVANEADDPTWARGRTGRGSVATGNSSKYSPITQERASKKGFAVPEGVEDYSKKMVGVGYIHPKE